MEANDNILELIEAWLRGELAADKAAELEQLMAEDAEFAAEVNSYKEAFDVMNETSWNTTEYNPGLQSAKDYMAFYTDEKNKAYFAELESISEGQQERRVIGINRRSFAGMVGVAAVIVLSIILLRDGGSTDYNALYAEYAALEEVPTFTVRGATDEVLSRIETQFQAGNYEDVNNIISDYADVLDGEQMSLVAIYNGISFGERGLYEEAYQTLNDDKIFANSIYGQMSQWYLALTMLKHEPDRKRAKELLSDIAADDAHYKQAEAKNILKKI